MKVKGVRVGRRKGSGGRFGTDIRVAKVGNTKINIVDTSEIVKDSKC